MDLTSVGNTIIIGNDEITDELLSYYIKKGTILSESSRRKALNNKISFDTLKMIVPKKEKGEKTLKFDDARDAVKNPNFSPKMLHYVFKYSPISEEQYLDFIYRQNSSSLVLPIIILSLLIFSPENIKNFQKKLSSRTLIQSVDNLFSEYLTTGIWSTDRHRLFPSKFRKSIFTLYLCLHTKHLRIPRPITITVFKNIAKI